MWPWYSTSANNCKFPLFSVLMYILKISTRSWRLGNLHGVQLRIFHELNWSSIHGQWSKGQGNPIGSLLFVMHHNPTRRTRIWSKKSKNLSNFWGVQPWEVVPLAKQSPIHIAGAICGARSVYAVARGLCKTFIMPPSHPQNCTILGSTAGFGTLHLWYDGSISKME